MNAPFNALVAVVWKLCLVHSLEVLPTSILLLSFSKNLQVAYYSSLVYWVTINLLPEARMPLTVSDDFQHLK